MIGNFAQHDMDSNRKEVEGFESIKIRELKVIIQALNTTVTRLRVLRDLYRNKNKDLIATNYDLEERIRALTIKEEIVNLNSNAKNQLKYLTKTSSFISIFNTTSKNNKKYSNVSDYYNNKDK